MKIGLVCDRIRWEEKKLFKTAEKSGLDLELVDLKTIFLNTHYSNKTELTKAFGDAVIQRCISYFRGLHVSAILENSNIKVINSFNISLICGNKLFSTLTLEKKGIPVPKTVIAFTKEGVTKALKDIGYPAVIKPVVGSWGRLIALLKDKTSAQAIIESREHMRNSLLQIYYLQEYVERPPRDIRVLVIGDEIVAASYRYSADDDWRTNVARGGKSESCPLTDNLKEIALKAAEAIGNGVLAVDCMESSRGILVHEVNSTVEFRGLCSTTKVDIPQKIINYVVKALKR
jgi:[lysine-biosynthesis-protein LysW]--L-2-aminoadipate ligase